MKRGRKDPICGMPGHIRAHGHCFCSDSCIRKYEKQKGMKRGLYCPECARVPGMHAVRKWYQERLYQVLLVLVGLFALNLGLTQAGVTLLQGFWVAFYDYLLLIWWAIILGFVIGGIVDYIVPNEYISKFLSKGEKKTIGWSVILGFMMSACSHGILAISMEFYKKGASVSAVVAFLLASPWANLPITLLLFSFFGVKAFLIIASAILIAIVTGLIYQGLERKGWVEKSKHTIHVSEKFSVRQDMGKRWRAYRKAPSPGRVLRGIGRGSWSLMKMVLWWIIIGMIFAAVARAFIHPELFTTYMGPTLLGLLITLIVATVIEVCSEGSSPISFEIFRQTGALGNSFTFLLAGVVTDVTELGLIWHNIGRRAAIWLPIITIPQVLALGYLFNIFL